MSLKSYALVPWIARELVRDRPVGESMREVIRRCDVIRPHADWRRLAAIDFDESTPLRNWFEQALREEPYGVAIRGLWFGLYNPCNDESEYVADIRVSGSETFTPDPNDCEWACESVWRPQSENARSAALANIYRIAYPVGLDDVEQEKRLGNDAEYPLCLAYGAFAVRRLLREFDRELLRGSSERIGVAVGFDSGDFLLVGELSSEGLSEIRLPSPEGCVIERMLGDLRSTDSRTAALAAMGLKEWGVDGAKATDELRRLARKSASAEVRRVAVGAVAAVAPNDPATKVTLFEAFDDHDAMVRAQSLHEAIAITDLSIAELETIRNHAHEPDRPIADSNDIALKNIALRHQAKRKYQSK